MAGVKKHNGPQQIHSRFYADGQEWKPCLVVMRKMFGNGNKRFMTAQSVQTGELYRNAQGRPMPWQAIPFSSIKPKELE